LMTTLSELQLSFHTRPIVMSSRLPPMPLSQVEMMLRKG